MSASQYRPAHRAIPSLTSASIRPAHQIPLSRRLLFPNIPPSKDLPPLLASPAAPSDLTAELYEFIALALRAFVNPWWTKITRYDKEFLPEVNRIIGVTVRSLEERVLATDLSPIVFRDIPILITQHYRDYRNATSKLATSYADGSAASLPQLFHQLQPHMAVSADGQIAEEYFRQIVDHVLKTCLPIEDYTPDAERFIIREVVLKVLLQDVIPKITQPWFMHKAMLDFLGPPEERSPKSAPLLPKVITSSSQSHSSHFSVHTLLVILLSAIQSISGACLTLVHAYKNTISTIKLVNQTPSPPPSSSSSTEPTSPPIPLSKPSVSTTSSTSSLLLPQPSSSTPQSPIPPSGDYARAPIEMFTEVFTTSDRFASAALVSTVSMLSVSSTPFLDRLLPYFLAQSLSPQFLTSMVVMAKHTLFPNGYPSPTPPDPPPEEQAHLREQLLSWRPRNRAISYLMSLILGECGKGNEARGRETMEGAVDAFGWRECNVHLVVFLIDRVVLGLWPELGVGGGRSRDGVGDENGYSGDVNRKNSGSATPVTPPDL